MKFPGPKLAGSNKNTSGIQNILSLDMRFQMGTMLWALLESLCKIHVLLASAAKDVEVGPELTKINQRLLQLAGG